MDITLKISLAIIAVVMIACLIRYALSLGRRILMGVLLVVFMIFVTPKINTFLINKVGQYGVLEQKLTEIVDGDIETKVKREYRMAYGHEIEDEALLEELKAEEYTVDPNMSDELNMIMACGLPKGITNTILLNISNPGTTTITASSFAEFAAKFVIVRIVTLISFLIAFSVSSKIFA